MVNRTVPGSPGEECGLGVRWGRALTAWVPGLESVDQCGAALGGSPQVWAGTSNNNQGPRSAAWRGTQPVAGQRQTMWSAGETGCGGWKKAKEAGPGTGAGGRAAAAGQGLRTPLTHPTPAH